MGKLIPKTQTGQVAILLFSSFTVLFIIFQQMVISGQRGGETFFSNLWLTIPFLSAVLFAIAGAIYGSISIVRDKERAIPVFFVCLIGFFVLLFVIAEFLFPH